MLATQYFYLVHISESYPFSYFSFLDIHMHICIYPIKKKVTNLFMCITFHLKMMPGKYLGKSDIPVYGNVENKLNSGVYYK